MCQQINHKAQLSDILCCWFLCQQINIKQGNNSHLIRCQDFKAPVSKMISTTTRVVFFIPLKLSDVKRKYIFLMEGRFPFCSFDGLKKLAVSVVCAEQEE